MPPLVYIHILIIKNRTWFKINGKVDENTSPTDLTTVRLLSLLPLFIRTDYEDVLTIGLGTGETANLTAQYPKLKSSDVVELSPAIINFAKKYYKKFSHHIFNDPRFKVINRDGREYIEHTNKKYDLIISEPSNPWEDRVGSLFTQEFFETTSSKLKPNGIASIWLHLYGLECDALESVILAAAKGFNYVALFQVQTNLYILATNEKNFGNSKLTPEMKGLEELLFSSINSKFTSLPRMQVYDAISRMWLMDSKRILRYDTESALINTDDNQYLQYSSGRGFWIDFGCFGLFTSK